MVAGLVLGATALAVAGPPAGAAPSVTVTPATDLLHFQPVQVAASGLAPDADHVVMQCAGDDCPSINPPLTLTPNVAVARSDAEGDLAVTVAVGRGAYLSGTEVDCSATPCTLRVIQVSTVEVVAEAPLDFAPTGTYQWPEATLEVTYPGPLRDGGPLQVAGEGYHWWMTYSTVAGPVAPTEICRIVDGVPDPEDDCVDGLDFSQESFRLDHAAVGYGTGVASGTVHPLRYLELPDGTWDCRLQGCTLALSQGRNPVSERVPLEWGPEWAGWRDPYHFTADLNIRIAGANPHPSQMQELVADVAADRVTGPEVVVAATSINRQHNPSPLPAGVNGIAQPNLAAAEVTRQYVALLGRRPDTPGLRFWVDRMVANRPIAWMADAFGASPEFRAQYAGLTPAQVVDRAYERLLGRPGDATGRAHWIGRLRRGEPAARVVMLMARSNEFRARQADHTAIEAITLGLLDRAATAQEWGQEPIVVARRALAATEAITEG